MNIEVEKVSECGLKREAWIFSTHAFPHLALTSVLAQERATRRHGWKGKVWNAYQRDRENDLPKPEEVPGWVVPTARVMLMDIVNRSNVYIGGSPEEKNRLKGYGRA